MINKSKMDHWGINPSAATIMSSVDLSSISNPKMYIISFQVAITDWINSRSKTAQTLYYSSMTSWDISYWERQNLKFNDIHKKLHQMLFRGYPVNIVLITCNHDWSDQVMSIMWDKLKLSGISGNYKPILICHAAACVSQELG